MSLSTPFVAPIIDLRTQAEFFACHLQGATHLPWAELLERLNELPPRPAKLILVASSLDILTLASNQLAEKNYQIQQQIWAKVSANVPSEQPGLVQFCDINSPNIQVTQAVVHNNGTSHQLWQPCSLIAQFSETYFSQLRASSQNQARSRALDLGCGGGRDAVYLSQAGWQVTAIEHKLSVLTKAQFLAKQTAQNIEFILGDMTHPDTLPECWLQQFQLVYGVRILNRALFPKIKQLIAPGGFVVWQTFSAGCEAFGSPKNPNYILQPGELAQTFDDFEIICDRIEYLPDGRPVASFIARKQTCGPKG